MSNWKLTPADVQRLYGPHFFLLNEPQKSEHGTNPKPETQAQRVAEAAVLFDIQAAPEARLAVVVTATDYEPASHQALLGAILLAIGTAPEKATRAFAQAPFLASTLASIQAEYVLIVGESLCSLPQNPARVGGQTVLAIPTLAHMNSDVSQKRLAWDRLKPLKGKV